MRRILCIHVRLYVPGMCSRTELRGLSLATMTMQCTRLLSPLHGTQCLTCPHSLITTSRRHGSLCHSTDIRCATSTGTSTPPPTTAAAARTTSTSSSNSRNTSAGAAQYQCGACGKPFRLLNALQHHILTKHAGHATALQYSSEEGGGGTLREVSPSDRSTQSPIAPHPTSSISSAALFPGMLPSPSPSPAASSSSFATKATVVGVANDVSCNGISSNNTIHRAQEPLHSAGGGITSHDSTMNSARSTSDYRSAAGDMNDDDADDDTNDNRSSSSSGNNARASSGSNGSGVGVDGEEGDNNTNNNITTTTTNSSTGVSNSAERASGFVCGVCQKVFRLEAALQHHYQAKHNMEPPTLVTRSQAVPMNNNSDSTTSSNSQVTASTSELNAAYSASLRSSSSNTTSTTNEAAHPQQPLSALPTAAIHDGQQGWQRSPAEFTCTASAPTTTTTTTTTAISSDGMSVDNTNNTTTGLPLHAPQYHLSVAPNAPEESDVAAHWRCVNLCVLLGVVQEITTGYVGTEPVLQLRVMTNFEAPAIGEAERDCHTVRIYDETFWRPLLLTLEQEQQQQTASLLPSSSSSSSSSSSTTASSALSAPMSSSLLLPRCLVTGRLRLVPQYDAELKKYYHFPVVQVFPGSGSVALV